MRKAGVPEWPFGFQPDEANRVPGAEIKALLYGHRIGGSARPGGSFEMVTEDDGSWVFRVPGSGFSFRGPGHVKGNLRCYSSPGHMRGETQCYAIYRNPKGTREERNEYVYSSGWGVYQFSVIE